MKKVEVFYIYGGSGLGKTTFVKNSLVGEQFDVVSFENGFWTGVTEDGLIAVYDSSLNLSEFSIILADEKLKYIKENKNGSLKITGLDELSKVEFVQLIQNRINTNYIFDIELNERCFKFATTIDVKKENKQRKYIAVFEIIKEKKQLKVISFY